MRADPLSNDHSPVADTEVHYLTSSAVGDEFKIFIGHCPSPWPAHEGVAPTPVYVLDANGFFGTAVEIVRLMQLAAQLPPILVVGIGYRLGALGETIQIRTRDLTISHDESFLAIYPDCTEMGGAPRMLEFIRAELMPWVAATFGVTSTDAMLFGHSFGGLFATYVLLTAPQTFRRYGIGSPSMWWHDELAFELERSYAEAHDDLEAEVFIGVGDLETFDGRQREVSRQPPQVRAIAALRPIDMVQNALQLAEVLRSRQYPHLRLDFAVFPDEFHVTVGSLSLSRALRSLFDAPL